MTGGSWGRGVGVGGRQLKLNEPVGEDPNKETVKKNGIYFDKTQTANLAG